MTMQISENGVSRDATPEEEAAILAQREIDSRPTLATYTAAIQMHLDAGARQRIYDGILTGITYRDDPNPAFAAEGAALFAWRSAVWTYATDELAKAEAELRPAPSVEDFIAELTDECPLVWPES